ncbi:MAG TPA: 4-oxalocrotonate tautomerase family protein [Bordetella sp.]|nr:4-oxalocrotonate tautomerase family protein [Bordetella sp.]
MPHIVIHLSGQPDAAQSRRVVDRVMALTQSVLGKAPPVTAITLQHIAPEAWFIGGRPLSESGHNAFHLDISVTDETNTKQEKARFIAAIYAAFQELLDNLHECSYVHVIDARAAAYGYGGATQEYRHQQASV